MRRSGLALGPRRPPFWRRWSRLALPLLATLGAAPGHAAPLAWITNQGSHDVSVVDLEARRVVATVPVGRSPAGVVVAPANRRVFVSNPDSRTISVIDADRRQVLAHWPAGDGPVGLDASADGCWLAAADWHRDRLLLWSLRSATGGAPPVCGAPPETAPQDPPPREIAVGRAPAGVAFEPDGRHAWVAERDDDRVARIDLQAGQVVERVAVGTHPFALLMDAPRRRLYALNVQSDDVSVIDLDTRRVVAQLPTGKAPYGAAVAERAGRLAITNQHQDSISLFDLATLRPVATVPGFGYPEGIAAQGELLVVVNWMDDDASLVDAGSGRLLGRVPLGRNPRGFGAFIDAAGDAASAPAPAAAPPRRMIPRRPDREAAR